MGAGFGVVGQWVGVHSGHCDIEEPQPRETCLHCQEPAYRFYPVGKADHLVARSPETDFDDLAHSWRIVDHQHEWMHLVPLSTSANLVCGSPLPHYHLECVIDE